MTTEHNASDVATPDVHDDASTEDYNQIDPGILDCFPPTRYPVDLFHLREETGTLSVIYRAGEEVGDRLRDSLRQLSEQGDLFFTRRQIEQYTSSVACNLNTALDDPNLTWDEKSGVFIAELKRRQDAIFAHPMGPELASLVAALNSLCSHLVEDSDRMAKVAHDVHCDLSPQRRRVNASLMALAVYLETHKGEIFAETLENVALGFFLYDIGMSKVSQLMLAKRRKLTPIELRTVQEHPAKSLKVLGRLKLIRPEITEPAIQHHERLNGSGYPNKLAGERIGHLGRIAAVADTYSAMVTDTPQRPGFAPIKAAAELMQTSAQYDPHICRTLIRFLQTVPS